MRQGTVAKTLSRLAAAGVVGVERRHIAGYPRRMKIYYLTPTGESVARGLSRHAADRPSGDPNHPSGRAPPKG